MDDSSSTQVKVSPIRRALRKHWLLTCALLLALAVLLFAYRPVEMLGYFQERASVFEVFALVLFLALLLPLLFQRLRLPGVVGLLVGGVLLGPYAFGIISPDDPTVELFAGV